MFVAGLVRGFSGFALSALVMAAAASFISPVLLIPILWFQEMAASMMMAQSGWKDSDRKTALLLVAGNWIGWPFGLYLTTTLPDTQSKMIALIIIITLAAMQLKRFRIPGLATTIGTLITGIVAGVVSGIAHVGGMVVALYVLAQNTAARSMRGTLVLYLFLGSLGALVVQLLYSVMTYDAMIRGITLMPVTMIGVWLGMHLFNPRWEPYYKPFCLGLLIALAAFGLVRLGLDQAG